MSIELSQYTIEEQALRDALSIRKACLIKALRKSRLASVTIDYDGEGDSGQIGAISARNAGGELVKLPERPISFNTGDLQSSYLTLEHAIEFFAWDVLMAYHGGFQDNDGGFGTITIDVAKGTVLVDHNARVTDVCNTQTEV